MRESIPRAKTIETGFRVLKKRLERSGRSINIEAARCMRRGDDEAVQRWVEVRHSVEDFAKRLDAFAQEWNRLEKASRATKAKKTKPVGTNRTATLRLKATPPSRFYDPALRSLAARGGEATFEQVLKSIETAMAADLTAADAKILPRLNVPRWHRTMSSVYRDCIREGWIAKRRDRTWALTEKGRRLAEGRRGTSRA